MRIKMLITRVGLRGQMVIGRVYDVPERDADRLIKSGKAEAVAQQPESAMLDTTPTPKRKATKKKA